MRLPAKRAVACPPSSPAGLSGVPHTGDFMTLEETTELAQKQANEIGVVMIVVKDDLSKDPGGL